MDGLDELQTLGLGRIGVLEADIDLRISVLFEHFEVFADDDLRAAALSIARASYGMGYVDAWEEPRAGSLFSDHGYRTPDRKVAV